MAEDASEKPPKNVEPTSNTPYQLDLDQTTKACKVLQQYIAQARRELQAKSEKRNLLDESTEPNGGDENAGLEDVPVWMILTGKKHIVDKVRLKPNKIRLPHPMSFKTDTTICLITADPQRLYKDSIANPTFSDALRPRITRVIGLEKLKARYKSFESKRQLAAEHDYFFADSRVWTYLPKILGKVFFQGGSKRPIPVEIGGPQLKDPSKAPVLGEKRRSTKGTNGNGAAKPQVIARELEKALSSTLVHLTTSNTTAIKVATANMSTTDTVTNIAAVIEGVTSRLLPQGWRNVRAIHIKGPNSPAFPVWLASELWANDEDILEEKKVQGKKRKRQTGRDNEEKQADNKSFAKTASNTSPSNDVVQDDTQAGDMLIVHKKTKSEEADARADTKEAAQRKQRLKKQKATILAEADNV